ncbi:hypothetical protein DFO70_106368 [Cytobacillus firmus]|uniref:Uncharacterized protein n=2 Tax=Cytobacillus TaxID=2675230 RepID=A0A366JVH7_CYTFI|nr:hypothetical protein DFO70_106368 [Cytobacillus firmus]TDX42835.1 hypothetical protein DFO72_106368 [Cytobacillus oceanisediminis]
MKPEIRKQAKNSCHEALHEAENQEAKRKMVAMSAS